MKKDIYFRVVAVDEWRYDDMVARLAALGKRGVDWTIETVAGTDYTYTVTTHQPGVALLAFNQSGVHAAQLRDYVVTGPGGFEEIVSGYFIGEVINWTSKNFNIDSKLLKAKFR